MFLKVMFLLFGSVEVFLLDIVVYGGYVFAGLCFVGFVKIMWGYLYYVLMLWMCLCIGVFLVKMMKCVLFVEVSSYDLSSYYYFFLFLVLV